MAGSDAILSAPQQVQIRASDWPEPDLKSILLKQEIQTPGVRWMFAKEARDLDPPLTQGPTLRTFTYT